MEMDKHSTNYFNSFILIAEDSAAKKGEFPPLKTEKPTIANMQFDLVIRNPYKFTSDEVLFQVYALRNGISKREHETEREAFFSKGQPCFRASPLTKRYGWGVHYNEEGRMALYGCETPEYNKLSKDPSLKVYKAMRSSR
jgi:hypothetical protein